MIGLLSSALHSRTVTEEDSALPAVDAASVIDFAERTHLAIGVNLTNVSDLTLNIYVHNGNRWLQLHNASGTVSKSFASSGQVVYEVGPANKVFVYVSDFVDGASPMETPTALIECTAYLNGPAETSR